MSGQGSPDCPLCAGPGGQVLARTDAWRVVWPDEPGYPGLLRVICNAHVAEMTDLSPEERGRIMAVVWSVEEAVRRVLAPDKVNLASLGNQVPHLHWHVIARWRHDRHFPGSIWSAPAPGADRPVSAIDARVRAALPTLFSEVREALARR